MTIADAWCLGPTHCNVVSPAVTIVGGLGSDAVRFHIPTATVENLGDLLGPGTSSARDISDDGTTTIGTWQGQAFVHHAISGMSLIGGLPGGDGTAIPLGLSGSGAVVVGSANDGTDDAAFIWDADHGMRSLQELLGLKGVDMTGWDLKEATGVSDDGLRVVGWGINPSGQEEAFVALIPEPRTRVVDRTPCGVRDAYLGRRPRGVRTRCAPRERVRGARREARPPRGRPG